MNTEEKEKARDKAGRDDVVKPEATLTENPEVVNFNGWFKAIRSPEVLELIRANSHAFVLLFVIAYRAQRTNEFNRYQLKPGEALLGDFHTYGMSEQNYRTAKDLLSKHNFATFKPTPKGTVATLINTRVFDVNIVTGNGQSNRQPTDGSRTANGQPTTTKKPKEGFKKKKKSEESSVASLGLAASEEQQASGSDSKSCVGRF